MKTEIKVKIHNLNINDIYNYGIFKNHKSWLKFIKESENGWIWHHPYFFNGVNKFSKCIEGGILYAELDGEILAFCPFGVKILDKNVLSKQVSLGNWSIPYPAIKKKYYHLKNEILLEFISLIEKNLNKKKEIKRILFSVLPQQEKIYNDSLNENPFLHIKNTVFKEEHTSVINLKGDLTSIFKKIRKRNMRYYKNNIKKFHFVSKTGVQINEDDFSDFLRTEKESSSNISTDIFNVNSTQDKKWPVYLVKNNLGVMYKVYSADKKDLYGIKIVLTSNKYAYDQYIFVPENFKKKNINFLLNVHAIQDLKKRNIDFFELGIFSKFNTVYRTPNKKQINISEFKLGFQKNLMKMHLAEKYLDKNYAKKTLISGINNFIKEI